MSQLLATKVSIDDYFSTNGIAPISMADITPRQKEVSRMSDDKYYEYYYTEALDEALISLDFSGHKLMYQQLLDEIGEGKDIIEPCYGSGILGCLLKLADNEYTGIESNIHAHKMAKARAEQNNCPESMFKANDFFAYEGEHEILVTSKYLGGSNLHVDQERIEKARQISPVLIGLEQMSEFGCEKGHLKHYENSMNKHGLKFEVLAGPIDSIGTTAKYFLFKAYK